MIGIGLIGYGYWGPNLLRNFAEMPDARVVACCDLRAERRALVGRKYPDVSSDGRKCTTCFRQKCTSGFRQKHTT